MYIHYGECGIQEPEKLAFIFQKVYDVVISFSEVYCSKDLGVCILDQEKILPKYPVNIREKLNFQ